MIVLGKNSIGDLIGDNVQQLPIEEKVVLMYKFGVIRQLIGKSVVGVWSPESNRLYLSIPQDGIGSKEDSTSFYCHCVSIPVSEDRLGVDGIIFDFNNSVWDEIEHELANTGCAEEANGELVEGKQAIDWIFSVRKRPGARVLTPMTSEDWDAFLDPQQSKEAIDAIRKNLISLV